MMKKSKLLTLSMALVLAGTLGSCGGGGGGSSGGSADNASGFAFATAGPERYARIDRMGQPAVGTALLSSTTGSPLPVDGNGVPVNPGALNPFNNFDSQRDALNRGDPINDARDFAFMFTRGPQTNSLANYHYKLGPQMRSLGLTPCSTETVVPPASSADVDISACVAQAGPVVIPDVITYDPNAAAGWPNGRRLDDPVIDRLLAAALLRLTAPHTLDALVGTINPTRDDSGTLSPAIFPFMRNAHPGP